MHDLLALDGWPASAVLTAAMVYALHRLLRRHGGEIAGLAAAAPIVSAPALVWLAETRGNADAAQASLAGLRLTVVLAAVVLAMIAALPRWVPASGGTIRCRPRSGSPLGADVFSAVCAGAVTAGCLVAGSHLSPAACGLLACLPWTAFFAFCCTCRCHGRDGGVRFLNGYLQGLAPRFVFFGVLGLALPPLGVPCAVALGLGAGSATLTLQRRLLQGRHAAPARAAI